MCTAGDSFGTGDAGVPAILLGGISVSFYSYLLLQGVSVLIHRSLDFQLFNKLIDPEERYVNLQCRIFKVTFLPSLNSLVLRTLLMYKLGGPDIHLILVGDLNSYLDPVLNKHPPPPVLGAMHPRSTLWKFIEEAGWIDP